MSRLVEDIDIALYRQVCGISYSVLSWLTCCKVPVNGSVDHTIIHRLDLQIYNRVAEWVNDQVEIQVMNRTEELR